MIGESSKILSFILLFLINRDRIIIDGKVKNDEKGR